MSRGSEVATAKARAVQDLNGPDRGTNGILKGEDHTFTEDEVFADFCSALGQGQRETPQTPICLSPTKAG